MPMPSLVHGGDIEGYRLDCGGEPLDFSANVSPFGLPPGVKEAVVRALDDADRYPDPLCRRLRAAIAAREGLLPEQVFCGNGAADVIDRLALALRPRRALIPAPTFAEYAQALARVGCAVERHVLREEEGFVVGEDLLRRIGPGIDLVVLCEPNNPTGRTTEPALLRRIARACADCGTLLLVDECFLGFLDDPEAHTLRPLLEMAPVYILRAFTKLYGMAGVRLGYGLCGDAALQEKLYAAGQPWSVSTLAQAAGIAALDEAEYVQRVRENNRVQRPALAKELARLGLKVYPPEANYILFRSEDAHLEEKMRSQGVLIRSCGNYPGLDSRYYRVAVRTQEENLRLLQALERCLSWPKH